MQGNIQQVGIVGLGYVGLPLAMMFVAKGFTVAGIELDNAKVAMLEQGRSYISDVQDGEIDGLIASGRFTAQPDYSAIPALDAVLICVPTPLNRQGEPDLSYIQQAGAAIAAAGMKPGQLVVLESSTYPGTTEDILLAALESSGGKVGSDFYVAYSPERINPGDTVYRREAMPKIVSGITPPCLHMAASLYREVFASVVEVSSTRAAEMAKVMENSQRFINISFVNDMARLCHLMDINIWEVIDAINTKPYGNLYFYPGPGVGGHCIPVDPLYLTWKAEQLAYPIEGLDYARTINDQMPDYILARIQTMLLYKASEEQQREPRILLLGLAYKKNVNDLRESRALAIMEKLVAGGAEVSYHDPLIPDVRIAGKHYRSVALEEAVLASADLVVLLTDHSLFSMPYIIAHSRLLLDTRNASQNCGKYAHVEIL